MMTKSAQYQEDQIDYLKLILTSKVYDVAHETPLQYAHSLSQRFGHDILLKREDLQSVFSFKIRGAYNKMKHLSPLEQANGVVCCSAGNHAQGVALSAKTLQIHSTIVMPVNTPTIKVDNVKRIGGEFIQVILHGEDFNEAQQECARIAKEQQKVLVHPFDDPYVIAGQGTVGVEIMKQAQQIDAQCQVLSKRSHDLEDIDAIFVCVGGGGLIAGITAYVKRIHPQVKVYAVEAIDACSLHKSLELGTPTELSSVGLFADGAAVKKVGSETFRVCQGSDQVPGIDGVILVTNDEICAAIKDVFIDTRTVLEPAGALSVAGMKKYLLNLQSEKSPMTTRPLRLVGVCSGANMDFDRLRFVAERASLGERKEAMLLVTIDERPGAFIKLYNELYPRSVTEFSYRKSNSSNAHIILSFQLSQQGQENDVDLIIEHLRCQNMRAINISHDEVAKTHLRYMVGGSCPNEDARLQERLVQFQFPEKNGALGKFLQCLNTDWNVSLFHYRNYGGDIGKVLVGIQVPFAQDNESIDQKFKEFLYKVGYPYVEVTDNEIYKTLLK
ncbi:hypothetical protein MP228_012824 [Amoeboaphelidium protococcarum]|nr:hypothetical protein MP228_012824 [Amoeboaphelidium protococcarum]